MRRILIGSVAALAMAGCGRATSPTLTTGLTGTVLRGPVTPVCTVTTSCDAPFSAGFTASRASAAATHFRSDGDGHFTVMLQPGTYLIVPDADAPLITPASQMKMVTVQEAGMTTVTLETPAQ